MLRTSRLANSEMTNSLKRKVSRENIDIGDTPQAYEVYLPSCVVYVTSHGNSTLLFILLANGKLILCVTIFYTYRTRPVWRLIARFSDWYSGRSLYSSFLFNIHAIINHFLNKTLTAYTLSLKRLLLS